MSDKRCGTLSPHGPHSWGDLNWCPGSIEWCTTNSADDTPDATANEGLSEGLTEAEREEVWLCACDHGTVDHSPLGCERCACPLSTARAQYAAIERIVAAREAAAATRARAEGAAAERERIARGAPE